MARSHVVTPRSSGNAPRAVAHLLERRGLRLTPEMAGIIAIFTLAIVALLGEIGGVIFVAASIVLILLRPRYNLGELVRFSPLLLLPLLAMLSTIWSEDPPRSMRSGLELLLTFVTAILVCRNTRPERMIMSLFLAFLFMVLLTLPAVPHALASKDALISYMGSKNQVGLSSYLLFALGLGVLFDPRQPVMARLVAIASLPFAVLIAKLSQSGGTTASFVLLLTMFPSLALLSALRWQWRISLAVLTLCLAIASSFFLSSITNAIADFRTNVLQKDATLTGRTYLWDFADRLSKEHPFLGGGYSAFWRQGNIDAEGLWRWGGVPNRFGFNFHNEFIGMRVDLGMVGEGLLIATCIAIAIAALGRQIARPSVALACLLSITLVNYSRAMVEQGLVAPFNLLSLIWLATALYAFPSRAPEEKMSSQSWRRQPAANLWRSTVPAQRSRTRVTGIE